MRSPRARRRRRRRRPRGADARRAAALRAGADIVVFVSGRRSARCVVCDVAIRRRDRFAQTPEGVTCVRCVGLEALVFLPAGDAGLTLRARHAAEVFAVVLQRRRGSYRRAGILVDAETYARVTEGRRPLLPPLTCRPPSREALALRVRELYPSLPEGREEQIARHAARRRRRLPPLSDAKVRHIVRAHVRHCETDYDRIIRGLGKSRARAAIKGRVEAVLRAWAAGPAGHRSPARSAPPGRREDADPESRGHRALRDDSAA